MLGSMRHCPRAQAAPSRAGLARAALAVACLAGALLASARAADAAIAYTAYVGNYGSGTVTPIDLASNTAGSPIAVGAKPWGIAITPDDGTAYVANSGAETLTPI